MTLLLRPRALTLYQPWATLVARGLKRFETRSWNTSYRGPLAVHAATRRPSTLKVPPDFVREAAVALDVTGPGGLDQLPRGAILAMVNLRACIPTEDLQPGPDQVRWGNFAPGRFAFALTDLRALPEPIRYVGGQRIWTVPAEVAAQLEPYCTGAITV